MSIPESDGKLLWGRAAGICSRPGCQADLTRLLDSGEGYHIGEMAHVIARSAAGPRGNGVGGRNSYDNLILLCPTCHREIDKAPEGEFSEQMLRSWKEQHEGQVRNVGLEKKLATFDELRSAVGALLAENAAIWKTLGPRSENAEKNPSSNAFYLWQIRRIDRIVPNNRRILNVIRANQHLLDKDQLAAFGEFVAHADAYEQHVEERLDDYPLFPASFGEMFGP